MISARRSIRRKTVAQLFAGQLRPGRRSCQLDIATGSDPRKVALEISENNGR